MHWFFIPDGHRRWAKKNNKSIQESYSKGLLKMFEILKIAKQINMTEMTVWAAATNNLKKRTGNDKEILFEILFNQTMIKKLKKLDCKVKFVGDLFSLPDYIQKQMQYLENLSHQNENSIQINVLFNASGATDILSAIPNIDCEITDINSLWMRSYTKNLNKIDIILRPGNRKRLSDCLYFSTREAEIYFEEYLWPDITPTKVKKIFQHYSDNYLCTFGA